jgi:3-hydroxyisobutyrate dehydrogenase-like beta-hydroxyacid dehydrogenase
MPMPSSSDCRIGFIGLGNMGAPMAAALAAAGLRPMVYDLRPAAVQDAVARGAVAAASVAELLAGCDVVGTCLLYDHQVRELFLGAEGIVALGRAGQVAAIHSTVLPETIRDIVAAAAAKGIGIVDAPVSGGGERTQAGALEGTLTVMVGAEDWAWERAQGMLRAVGRHVIRVGGPGAGQIVKLGNNIMALGNQVLHMEAIRFVEAFGVRREALDEVALVSSGASWAVASHAHFDRYGFEHTLGGTPEMPHRLGKDLRYAVAVAQEQHTYLPVVSLCAQLLPGMFEARWARVAAARAAGTDSKA